ncbi:T9SS type A sorting domain-containing protein [Flavobacterium sp.]|uniref:T9SS type A sorting domain-containing protein n=1 Tax=Flavobacterium sp. TaxID=239 RepID=UPI0035297D7D
MNKKMLFSLLVLLSVMTSNAQSKVWNFLTNMTILPDDFPGVPGGTEDIVDDLGRFAHITSDNFSKQSTGSSTFPDGFQSGRRANMNGGSVAEGALPTMRFFFFDVSDNCNIKVWAREQNTSSRTLLISDGENVLASASNASNPGAFILEANNTNGARRIFIYTETNGFGIYKIEVDGVTVNTTIPMSEWLLNVQDTKLSNINYYVKDSRVYLKNIDSQVEVSVYTITGQLVKSLKTTSSDFSFDVDQGFYILKLNSSERQKTIKLVVN